MPVVAGAAGAAGPAVVVAAAPAGPPDVVAPKRPPVVFAAAGAPLEAGGCEELVPAAPNNDGADEVAVAAVPACEVEPLDAPPPRLEKRFDVVPVPRSAPEAPEVFCCPLKILELCPPADDEGALP